MASSFALYSVGHIESMAEIKFEGEESLARPRCTSRKISIFLRNTYNNVDCTHLIYNRPRVSYRTRDRYFMAHFFLSSETTLKHPLFESIRSLGKSVILSSIPMFDENKQKPDISYEVAPLCDRDTQTPLMTSADDHVIYLFHDTNHYPCGG
jgi:hypothetical protein